MVMTFAVQVCGSFFERLLFINFNSVEDVEWVVAQRTVLHIAVDVVTMSQWYVVHLPPWHQPCRTRHSPDTLLP